MIKEIDAYINLKINDINININIDDKQTIKIYKDNTLLPIENCYFGNTNKQILTELGFTQEEIEKMYLLSYARTIDVNDIIVIQNTYEAEKKYKIVEKYIATKSPLSKHEIQALTYIDKETISFEEYKQLPKKIKNMYYLQSKSREFPGKYKSSADINTENIKFVLSIVTKFKNHITYMIFNSKLTAIRNKGNDILKIKISTNNINIIPVTIKENITDDADHGYINYNIIPLKDLNNEFEEMFKDFDTSKLIKIQISKDEVLKNVKNNYLKTEYYYRLKPEISKQKEALVKKIAKALCQHLNKDAISDLINEATELLTMPYYPETDNPNSKYYECYNVYKHIDEHIHNYTMQNDPCNIKISDAIHLMEIILTK